MAFPSIGCIPRLSLCLALLATLSACLPSNEPIPTATLPAKSPTPIPASATPIPSLTPRPSPTTDCLTLPGQLVEGIVASALLDKPMTYRVYLPPCYAEETSHRYPVLYLLHGQTFNEDQWIRLGVPATMDRLIAAGEIAPFIVVFPYDYAYLQPHEYHFEDVFMQLLLPQIDADYRTNAIPAQRAVGGLSRGGGWALHLGIRHPDVFGAIGAHSPAIFYSDGKTLPPYLLIIPPSQVPRLYVDIGDSDGNLKSVLEFITFLDENNIPHEWHAYIGWHDEVYWGAHVEEYLRWYAQGWGQ